MAVIVAALTVLLVGPAAAACQGHQAPDCLVDLTLKPAVSRQIVAGEKIPAPSVNAPPVETLPPYTGPTVGAVPNIPRAPEIGYRWSIN
ncbi:MAG TPA: hypothetical protein VMF86_04495 [Stellaceae bacterium]|nr:hypothetical protein [Stellaceae bacterium]